MVPVSLLNDLRRALVRGPGEGPARRTPAMRSEARRARPAAADADAAPTATPELRGALPHPSTRSGPRWTKARAGSSATSRTSGSTATRCRSRATRDATIAARAAADPQARRGWAFCGTCWARRPTASWSARRPTSSFYRKEAPYLILRRRLLAQRRERADDGPATRRRALARIVPELRSQLGAAPGAAARASIPAGLEVVDPPAHADVPHGALRLRGAALDGQGRAPTAAAPATATPSRSGPRRAWSTR